MNLRAPPRVERGARCPGSLSWRAGQPALPVGVGSGNTVQKPSHATVSTVKTRPSMIPHAPYAPPGLCQVES